MLIVALSKCFPAPTKCFPAPTKTNNLGRESSLVTAHENLLEEIKIILLPVHGRQSHQFDLGMHGHFCTSSCDLTGALSAFEGNLHCYDKLTLDCEKQRLNSKFYGIREKKYFKSKQNVSFFQPLSHWELYFHWICKLVIEEHGSFAVLSTFFVLRAKWCMLPIVVIPWPNTLVVFQWLFRCKQAVAWLQSKLSHQGLRLGNLRWPWYPFPERQVTKNSFSSAISASTEIIHKLGLQT